MDGGPLRIDGSEEKGVGAPLKTSLNLFFGSLSVSDDSLRYILRTLFFQFFFSDALVSEVDKNSASFFDRQELRNRDDFNYGDE